MNASRTLALVAVTMAVACGSDRAPRSTAPPVVEPPAASGSRGPADGVDAPLASVERKSVAESAFVVPATRPAADGWTEYVEPHQYDSSSVADLAPGTNSPEAAVVHYLASRVRGDARYQQVMASECSRKCARGLAKHAEWTFVAFRLVGRKEAADGKLWVKAWFTIRAKGKQQSGTDEFTLVHTNDGWRIVEVPT